MDAPQLELFAPYKHTDPVPDRAVIVSETNLGRFGNRTDVIVVGGRTVRGTSLLECDDADVQYFNNQSPSP